MRLRFLGAATTVTGSQFLLTTERARVVIDCGLFQGSPAESERSRVPLAYDPADVDAVLVTHCHLDHCGLLPVVVREGFTGPGLPDTRHGGAGASWSSSTAPRSSRSRPSAASSGRVAGQAGSRQPGGAAGR